MSITDIIFNNQSKLLDLYLTAPWGYDLCVWADGLIDAIESSIGFHPYEQPSIRISCPGIDNLDREYFTADFCDWDTEADAYVVTSGFRDDTGRIVGDIADVIRECIRDGDMSGYWEDLYERLIENLEEI